MSQIQLTQDQGVASIVIDDEARYNAISLSMWVDLKLAFDKIENDQSVRVVVMRGAGEKAFVSGANITEFETQRNSHTAVSNYNLRVAQALNAIAESRVPVIAAISGICYGGGLELALSCDMRYCAPLSKFRMPAARLGLGYSLDGMQKILKNLSPIVAAEVFYTAKVYKASEAMEMGLVNSVQTDVFMHVAQVAAEIANNAPLTIRAAKQAMNSITHGSPKDRDGIDQMVEACFQSKDYAEGRLAFSQKRDPQFIGR